MPAETIRLVPSPSSASANVAATNNPLMISADDLARELGISTRTVRRLDLEGKLPGPVRIGRAVRWPRQTIVEWIAAGAPPRREWEAMRNDL
jgi:excisionase family DNA binding protein